MTYFLFELLIKNPMILLPSCCHKLIHWNCTWYSTGQERVDDGRGEMVLQGVRITRTALPYANGRQETQWVLYFRVSKRHLSPDKRVWSSTLLVYNCSYMNAYTNNLFVRWNIIKNDASEKVKPAIMQKRKLMLVHSSTELITIMYFDLRSPLPAATVWLVLSV